MADIKTTLDVVKNERLEKAHQLCDELSDAALALWKEVATEQMAETLEYWKLTLEIIQLEKKSGPTEWRWEGDGLVARIDP